ncbi:MAG: AGE family epimerase/isomerase [Bacteroidota bacterium]
MSASLARLHREAYDELTGHILPYWLDRTIDETHGGFIGRITGEDRIIPDAPKGAVLNARLLWTFASAARVLDDESYLPVAFRAYQYLRDHFADPEHGGVYWLLDHTGQPLDSRKQTYAQAFVIYGLAELYRLHPHPQALAWAKELYDAIETNVSDAKHGGYVEARGRDWTPISDIRLSEKDENTPKSMNTHLHVLEGYANLYRIWPDAHLRERLRDLIELFLDRIVAQGRPNLLEFFSCDWTPTSDVVSFGHDIEASWLVLEAAEVLGDPPLIRRVQACALDLAEATLKHGIDTDGGMFNAALGGHVYDTDKHWWPQAEAVVGFLNAFQISDDPTYLNAALRSWAFIQNWIIDAEGGEWHFRVSWDRVPYREEDKVGPWKCPYHNARACLEVLERVRGLVDPSELASAVVRTPSFPVPPT